MVERAPSSVVERALADCLGCFRPKRKDMVDERVGEEQETETWTGDRQSTALLAIVCRDVISRCERSRAGY